MFTHLCLLSCVLTLGQPAIQQSWQLAPQLSPGQELVYQGLYKERSLVPGVAFQREYRVQTRMLVLDTNKDGWDVAVLTALELLPDGPGSAPFTPAKFQKASLKLELARIDKKGNLHLLDKSDATVPLDGPPILEHGFLVPSGNAVVMKQESWLTPEPGRPGLLWSVTGTELMGGNKCIKMTGEQESPNWNDPQAAGDAWQRLERVWVHPLLKVAVRVEREIKHRDAARTTPTHVATLRYDKDLEWTYPAGDLLEARKHDIQSAVKFTHEADELLPEHLKNAAALEILVKRVKLYVEQKEPVEPYRQVMEQVLHRIEAVRKGEIVVKPATPAKTLFPAPTPGARVGDFVVNELTSKQTVRLYDLLGRPVLLIFYNPNTEIGERTMLFARNLQTEYGAKLHILALAVTHKAADAVAQHKELSLPFPIVDGNGLHQTFAVDATPRIILVDGDGTVRGAYTGWSFLITDQILADLKKCCPGKKSSNP